MLRYTKSQYYIETIFSKFWAAAFLCQNCLHYNLENDHFDLDKTWNYMTKTNTGNPEIKINRLIDLFGKKE